MVKSHSSTKKLKKPAPSRAPDLQTRERILDAAHSVFLRKGTANSRTQEIADEAGVNKALVHYYFGTKAALADAIFERSLGAITPRIFGILADPNRTIEQKVPDIMREQIEFHSARPYLAGYLLSEMHAEPDRLARLIGRQGGAPLDVLRRQLREAARAGKMRPISAEQFVVNLMGLLIFPFAIRPALMALVGLDESRWPAFLDERRRLLPDFFLAGLRP
ncbi:MAG TPA: TetR/AcrR family transcriptional regulator [Gemmatimonadales bacterium]|jgi:AcrR family transcriptional regulator|nr:TetR/AcrR family transcriptional regulator [Gemmatimonadales bacterium]